MSSPFEAAKIRLVKLKQQKQNILNLDTKLIYEDQISQCDRDIFAMCIELIDKEIDRCLFELELEEMLESNLPLRDFLDKYGPSDLI